MRVVAYITEIELIDIFLAKFSIYHLAPFLKTSP